MANVRWDVSGSRSKDAQADLRVMRIISNATFENETVHMDDVHFEDCVIENCVLEYSGRELTLERTQIRGCRLKLTEEAGRTLHFLQCMGYMEDVAGEWAPAHPNHSNNADPLSILARTMRPN